MSARSLLALLIALTSTACPLAPPTAAGGYACVSDVDCREEGYGCYIVGDAESGVCVPHTALPRDAGVADAGIADAGFDAGPPCGVTPARGLPFEVCDDGVDNDDDGATDTAPCWTERIIQIAPRDPLPAGYTLAVSLDHKSLVENGLSLPSGDDVQVWNTAGASPRQVPRAADPDASWRGPFTTVWFALASALSATTFDYRLYHGPAPAEEILDDESAVFHYADFFARPDAEQVGGGWTVTLDSDQLVGVRRGAMYFARTADRTNRPVADHAFAPLTGRFVFAFGFDWRRANTVEGEYRVHMQLRDAVVPAPDAGPDVPPAAGEEPYQLGAGPSMVWAGTGEGLPSEEMLTWEQGGTLHEVGTLRGRGRIEGRVNLDLATYDIFLNGQLATEGAVFANAVPEIDQVRVFSWRADDAAFAPRAFRFFYVRRVVQNEPASRIVSTAEVCIALREGT